MTIDEEAAIEAERQETFRVARLYAARQKQHRAKIHYRITIGLLVVFSAWLAFCMWAVFE